jgi:tripartite-type tricarboxylate transporter receptor subunit TctC
MPRGSRGRDETKVAIPASTRIKNPRGEENVVSATKIKNVCLANHFVRLACLAAIALAVAAPWAPVQAQTWPTKTVRIVIPYPAGGGLDALGRQIADKLATRWAQSVVVENRPGSATFVGAVQVARSEPDGHTILLTSDSTVSINPYIFAKLPYDPQKDFVPITNLMFMNFLLTAHRALQVNTVSELIALARAKPSVLNYASYGNGSQPHLIMEMLKANAKIDVVHIPYKGGPQAVMAAVAGQVGLAVSSIPTSLPHVETGVLKPLAFGGTQRSPHLPNVPTFAELGYSDVGAYAWYGMFLPAGTPQAVVKRIYQDVKDIMNEPRFRAEQIALGYDMIANSPEEFAAYLRTEGETRAKAVKVSGIKMD